MTVWQCKVTKCSTQSIVVFLLVCNDKRCSRFYDDNKAYLWACNLISSTTFARLSSYSRHVRKISNPIYLSIIVYDVRYIKLCYLVYSFRISYYNYDYHFSAKSVCMHNSFNNWLCVLVLSYMYAMAYIIWEDYLYATLFLFNYDFEGHYILATCQMIRNKLIGNWSTIIMATFRTLRLENKATFATKYSKVSIHEHFSREYSSFICQFGSLHLLSKLLWNRNECILFPL